MSRCEHGVSDEDECSTCDGPSIIEGLRSEVVEALDRAEAAEAEVARLRAALVTIEEWDGIEWHRDPAASGWRSRAFLPEGELLAYDDGNWEVRLTWRLPSMMGQTVAFGREICGERAKCRALRVYRALVESVSQDL